MTLKCFKTKTDGSAYLFVKKELAFSLPSLVLYLITRGTEKSLCSSPSQCAVLPCPPQKATGNQTPVGHTGAALVLQRGHQRHRVPLDQFSFNLFTSTWSAHCFLAPCSQFFLFDSSSLVKSGKACKLDITLDAASRKTSSLYNVVFLF